MNDTELLDILSDRLYSAFPALMTTGIVIWMVNLKKKGDILHGEGSTLRAAIIDASRKEGKP